MPEEGFVSISRASILLEAPERTVRRVSAKLADSDRHMADTGARLVRLSELALLMGKPWPLASVADSKEANGGQVADTLEGLADKKTPLADSGRQAEGSNLRQQESALVAQLRSELEHRNSEMEDVKQDREHWREQAHKWEAQAEKSLQLVDQAQRLQLVAERKVAELEGKLLPALEAPRADSSGDSGPGDLPAPRMGSGGGITTLGSVETVRAPGEATKLQPWWAFWKGRG
ncbi:hypothetical protein [Armatimonas sp.]|uniref:hypothetical protein n=1 Tax=Armatimonas sp. TaxID=1872638 RepID=UPI0037513F4F